LSQKQSIEGIYHQPATSSDHQIFSAGYFPGHFPLHLAKGGLAFGGENIGDRLASFLYYQFVSIQEFAGCLIG
jgi:hypothetical protein